MDTNRIPTEFWIAAAGFLYVVTEVIKHLLNKWRVAQVDAKLASVASKLDEVKHETKKVGDVVNGPLTAKINEVSALTNVIVSLRGTEADIRKAAGAAAIAEDHDKGMKQGKENEGMA